MSTDEQKKIEELAKALSVSREFVETSLNMRQATSMREKLNAYNKERAMIEQGPPEAVQKQHESGRLTARERVHRLLDPDSFEELDLWHRPYETGFDIGEETGQGDGVVIGYGTVGKAPVSVWSQDATVMGGTVGTVHARKVTMLMENALNARTPLVGIIDSKGVRVQDAIQYPDYYSCSSMAYFQTQASGVVPRISLIMGPCTGEVAVVANLSDFVFMVRNTSYMHLMPPPPSTTSQDIGDPWKVQAKNGVCDVLCQDEADCLAKCRQLLSYLPASSQEYPPVVDTGDDPNRREEALMELVPVNTSKVFDMYKLMSLIFDRGEFFEIKRYFASNLITGFARLDGHTVGIMASNPQSLGGCMNLDAADKMSRFVRFCDSFNIPLLWLADTPAFLPAIDEERRGLIRHGSRMIMANSEATVPEITLAVRKHFGGGRLAMPGQALGGDMLISWPAYEPGLMGARGGVAIVHARELAGITDPAARKAREDQLVEELQFRQDIQVREWTQKIIDPRETRPFLIKAFAWLRNKKRYQPAKKHENVRM